MAPRAIDFWVLNPNAGHRCGQSDILVPTLKELKSYHEHALAGIGQKS